MHSWLSTSPKLWNYRQIWRPQLASLNPNKSLLRRRKRTKVKEVRASKKEPLQKEEEVRAKTRSKSRRKAP